MSKLKSLVIKNIYNACENVFIYPAKLISDKVRHVDFHRIELNDIENVYYYEGTHIRITHKLKKLLSEVTKDDAILDIGCGKGKMLDFFSRYPFSHVDGVEITPRFASIARENIKRLGISSIIYNVDVRDFDHFEQYNYFYFYNPFPEEIMKPCLLKIIESKGKISRRITIFYANPLCHQTLIDCGFKEIELEQGFIEKIWSPYISGLKMYILE